jgi:hypothetical protein
VQFDRQAAGEHERPNAMAAEHGKRASGSIRVGS